MKRLLIFIFLASFCFGQGYFYHTLFEDEIYVGTSTTPRPKVEILSSNRLVTYYAASATTRQILKIYSYSTSFELTLLDTLITAVGALAGDITRIDDTHFLAVIGDGGSSDVKTYSIDGSGVMTRLDSLRVNQTGNNIGTCQLNADTYAAVIGRSNGNEMVGVWDVDLDTWDITQLDLVEIASDGNGAVNDIHAFGDGTQAIVWWRDDAYDMTFQTISFDGSWQITLTGSSVVANGWTMMMGGAFINDHTYAAAAGDRSVTTQANYYAMEWDEADGTGLTVKSTVGSMVKVNGMPALVRMNDTEFVALNGLDAGTGVIESFSLDGENQITANDDRTPFYATGNVRANDIWATAFDDSTLVAILKDTDNDMWLVTVRISLTEEDPIFPTGWSHQVLGVETPTAVNSASEFTKVSGVE